ncbi:aryl-alcohol dehydrogenase-like predicted oxidoreductase [Luteibacter jiangsuensis]|uniref:Aryl-alcohol dehydrogenase-like predicted oxidoreductase n=1 Tax=Luteibacter jiangsuensis TaxID=637577 RepID=A0ABT9SX35_9GAMM|nr:aldo/keto reductase [Luteibacter jiangsuensis]MDQ0009569.1 aryl-alcohol dehydrogenase-like predicted oxidoreductase [Luteibacter jiangsuensis]
MKLRNLGRSPLRVAPLAFGGNVFGWSADEPRSFDLLDAFVDHGFNLIDTADVYEAWVPGNEGGESETIIGKWLKKSGKRDKVVIATKVGKWARYPGLAPTNIKEAVEDSLRRLQTDHIDLYQSHEDDPKVPLEETLRAFDDLVKTGKVRVIGASNYDATRLADALSTSASKGLARYESMQPEYNLMDRKGFEEALQPLCVKEQVGVISYYSLASGFLSGKYRSEADLAKSSARGGKVKAYLNDRGYRVLAALDEVSRAHDAKPAQVALAWVMAQPSIAAAIASATSLEQLDEIAKAATLELTPADLATLKAASDY